MNFEQQLQLGADHLSKHDPIMKRMIAECGLPTFRPHRDYYQQLVKSIIGQQLSVRAAATILGRFIDLFGHFPLPSEIMATEFKSLKSVGLSRSKTNYIIDLATKISDGSLVLENLAAMTNEQIIEHLTVVKGIGVWTVHMFLLFAMGRLDVLAVGDLGVRTGLTQLYAAIDSVDIFKDNSKNDSKNYSKEYKFDHVFKDAEIQLLAHQFHWQPYESLVCWYAWQALKTTPLP